MVVEFMRVSTPEFCFSVMKDSTWKDVARIITLLRWGTQDGPLHETGSGRELRDLSECTPKLPVQILRDGA